jgi:PAS domain S-box-containing protein
VAPNSIALAAALEDIFVAVALLTISVGLVLPGMIAHAAEEVARAADHLATGTLADLLGAMQALGEGRLDAAHARVDVRPVVVHTRDELGAMATSFNTMQATIARAASALDVARAGLAAASAALQGSEERVRAILDATSEAILLLSRDGRILAVNRRFEEIFGMAATTVLGRDFVERTALHEQVFADPPAFRAMVTASAPDTERQFRQTFVQVWPRRRELDLSSVPVPGADGSILGRLYAFRDVTQERSADRVKSEFVSVVSHELRTPLTSIKGYVDLVLAGDVGEISAEQREFLGIARQNADRLVNIVNDLLDLSRLEGGEIALHRAPLDLAKVVEQAAQALRPQLDRKRQRLTVDMDQGLPLVSGDPNRLVQVFTNLLSNAHKYTPAGGEIGVAAAIEGELVRVEVRDNGVGMTDGELDRLFTRFFRAKNPATQEVGGAGLGLVITKWLVELHGGTIAVASTPGAGSVFGVTLPALPAVRGSPAHVPVPRHGDHRVVAGG